MNHHHHDHNTEISPKEKLIKLLEHWGSHNEDHATTYHNWAITAKGENLKKVAELLEEAAAKTVEINNIFTEALKFVRNDD